MAQRCTRAWRQLEVKNENKSITISGHDYAGKRGDHGYFVQFFDGLSKLRVHPRVHCTHAESSLSSPGEEISELVSEVSSREHVAHDGGRCCGQILHKTAKYFGWSTDIG